MPTKRTALAPTCTVLAAFLIALVGAPVIDSPVAAATIHCKQISAHLETTFTSPTTTIGEITGDGWLKGTTNYAADNLVDGPQPATSSYSGELVVTTKKGTLTLRDVGVFLAAPGGPFAEYDTVSGGTGRFAGATGLLFIHGTMNAAGNGFTGSISGELCAMSP